MVFPGRPPSRRQRLPPVSLAFPGAPSRDPCSLVPMARGCLPSSWNSRVQSCLRRERPRDQGRSPAEEERSRFGASRPWISVAPPHSAQRIGRGRRLWDRGADDHDRESPRAGRDANIVRPLPSRPSGRNSAEDSACPRVGSERPGRPGHPTHGLVDRSVRLGLVRRPRLYDCGVLCSLELRICATA